jgi:hypothetical protein
MFQACPPQGMAANRISVSRAQPAGFPGFEQPKNRAVRVPDPDDSGGFRRLDSD